MSRTHNKTNLEKHRENSPRNIIIPIILLTTQTQANNKRVSGYTWRQEAASTHFKINTMFQRTEHELVRTYTHTAVNLLPRIKFSHYSQFFDILIRRYTNVRK